MNKKIPLSRFFLHATANHRYAITGLAVALVALPSAASALDWATTATHATDVHTALCKERVADAESIDVTVALKLRDRAGLEHTVTELTRPGSPQFRRWLSDEQLANDHAPSRERVAAVVAYLQSQGFTNIEVTDNRLLINARASAASIRSAFDTDLARYLRDGHEGMVAVRDIRIPAELGDTVLAVLGLQTLNVAQPASMRVDGAMATSGRPVAMPDTVEYAYPATEFPTLYGASSLAVASTAQVGVITVGDQTQTITDLHTFESQSGYGALTPAVVYVGGSATAATSPGEWQLDTQDILAMAGGKLGGLTLYSARSFSNADLTNAYNAALSGTAKVINVSIEECESSNHSDGSMAADDNIFLSAISKGKTFSVATGDHASKECGASSPNGTAGTVAGASYPASSPWVVAVGGTNMSATNGVYTSEAVWYASGGEPSLIETAPQWQSDALGYAKRAVPDVAFHAAGSNIIVTGTTQTWWGTSLSSPLFVGAWARIEAANGNGLGFPMPLIYGYGRQAPTTIFNDVTSGSNGDYTATDGWDYASGYGSFNVAKLSAAMTPVVAISNTAPTLSVVSEKCNGLFTASWTAVSGATSYKLWFNNGSTGAIYGLMYNGAGTSHMFNEGPGGTLTLDVQACNGSLCGPLSARRTAVGYSGCQ